MTTESWSEGYFAKIAYATNYYREQSPALMRFNLLMSGVEASDNPAPAHCELGFGQGLTLAINAACCGGQWFANDFMPEHVSIARQLLQAFSSGAVISDASFQHVAADASLPKFDTISLHGIWSWVNDENRQAIVRFLEARLKPGGIVYISYNTLPGWSSLAPIQYLMELYGREALGSGAALEAKVAQATSFMSGLASHPQGFFERNPSARQEIESLRHKDAAYMAHEYFNAVSTPMYFAQVVHELGKARLEFAARSDTLDIMETLFLRRDSIQFLDGLPNALLREQARDYLFDRAFRRDQFVRGVRRMPAVEQMERLQATYFVPMRALEGFTKVLEEAKIPFNAELYGRVIEALKPNRLRPQSLGELMAATGLSYAVCREVLVVLTGKALLVPCQPRTAADNARQACSKLNAHLMQQTLGGAGHDHLASPVVGAGVPVNRVHQMFLAAHQRGEKDIPAFIIETLALRGEHLKREERVLGREDAVALMKTQHEQFRANVLPVLGTLGIS